MATEVVIPMLGVTVEKGIIVEWLIKEGDAVQRGDSIFIVEADKVTTEVEAPASGTLSKVLVPEGIEVPVLTVVGLITAPGEALPADDRKPVAADLPKPDKAAPAPPSVAAPSIDQTPPLVAGPMAVMPSARKRALEKGIALEDITPSGPDGVILLRDVAAAEKASAVKASTLARRLAARKDVDVDDVKGSGVRGRVMQADVRYAAAEAKQPALGKVLPLKGAREVIARRMSESAFTAPHIYFFTDIEMDALLQFRERVLSDFEEKFGLRPSINDFLIKAVALNICDFPMLNAAVKEAEIHIAADVNICLAVALEDGLIVPAIAHADMAGLVDIARQRRDLVARARQGRLTMEELERGTFTISSLAQYDITHFTAILNPPQSGILSVGKTRSEVFMDEAGSLQQHLVATFGLSVDHRIIDGALAARFLRSLKMKLTRPAFTFLNL